MPASTTRWAPASGRGKSSNIFGPGRQRGGASGDGGEPLPGCSSGDGASGGSAPPKEDVMDAEFVDVDEKK